MVMSGQRDPCRSPMQWDKSKNSGFTQGNNTMLGLVNFFYSKTLGIIYSYLHNKPSLCLFMKQNRYFSRGCTVM